MMIPVFGLNWSVAYFFLPPFLPIYQRWPNGWARKKVFSLSIPLLMLGFMLVNTIGRYYQDLFLTTKVIQQLLVISVVHPVYVRGWRVDRTIGEMLTGAESQGARHLLEESHSVNQLIVYNLNTYSPINREFYLAKVQKSLYLAGIFYQAYY
jgi:hypothetical protein